MAFKANPSCHVYLRDDPTSRYEVQSRHYEVLRDRLDANEKGWVELDSAVGDGDAKLMVRLEDIQSLFLSTPSHCDATDARNLEGTLS